MHITHSYLGTTKGRFRCMFFLLLEDYIQAQSQFVRELDLVLERFARNMKDSGVLVRPFAGDIEITKSHVLAKNWIHKELEEIGKTPGLLMIDVDFDRFDPREHRWLHFCFGKHLNEGVQGAHQMGEALIKLAEAICDADIDIFRTANSLQHEIRLIDAAKIFEAKPGAFGLSIDLIKGVELFTNLYRRIARKNRI